MSMRNLLCSFVLVIAAALPAHSQAVRFDSNSYTTSASCVSGKICPVLAIPGSVIAVCQPPNCSAVATTYTSTAASVACASNAPLTPATGGACRATSDNQGGFGFWVLPGDYNYYITIPAAAGGGTYGPYPISIHGDAGGYTLDSLYSTLPLACAAAGSGTLAITRAWNALSTQTVACNLWFLANGKLQPASGQVLTLSGTITAPPFQVFDYVLSGTVTLTGLNGPAYPQWFGSTGSALGNACTALSAGTLLITKAWTAVPTGAIACALQFQKTGTIQPDSGATVTLTGSVNAPLVQVFDNSAGGTVAFSGTRLAAIYPEWWGADPSGVSDSVTAINAALVACPTNGTVQFSDGGVYKATSAITPPSRCTLSGFAKILTNGFGGSIFSKSTTVTNFAIRNMTLDGGTATGGISVGAAASTGATSGITLQNVTFQSMGAAHAIQCGNQSHAAYTCSNISSEDGTYSSTGGVLIGSGDTAVFRHNTFATVTGSDAIQLYNNCSSLGLCQGRGVVIAGNRATDLGRMFAEVQGSTIGAVIADNSVNGMQCASDSPGCYGISFVDGFQGVVSGNNLTYGYGSGAIATSSVSGGSVSAITVSAGGSAYTVAPIVIFSGQTGTAGRAARGVATISGGAVVSVAVTDGGSGYGAVAPAVNFIPATPAAVLTTPCIEIGSIGALVSANTCNGWGVGVSQDENAKRITISSNQLNNQNVIGMQLAGDDAGSVTGNVITDAGTVAITESSVSMAGAEIAGNKILRGLLPTDSGRTAYGISLATTTYPANVHDNNVTQLATVPTLALFYGIAVNNNIAGTSIHDNSYLSLSTTAFGNAIYNGTTALANYILRGNTATKAASLYTGTAPAATSAVSDNICVSCTSVSSIDSTVNIVSQNVRFTNAGAALGIIVSQLIGGGSTPAIFSGFGSGPAILGTDAFGLITLGTGTFKTGAITLTQTYAQKPACWAIATGSHFNILNASVSGSGATPRLTIDSDTNFTATATIAYGCGVPSL